MRKVDALPARLALIGAVVLNCVGILMLRYVNHKTDEILSLALGYLLGVIPLLVKKFKGKLKKVEKKDYRFILLWASSLTAVYVLFFSFPKLVTPAQVILGLTLAPTLATFIAGEQTIKKMFLNSKLNLVAILVLLVLPIVEAIDRHGSSLLTYALVVSFFVLSQTSLRKLAHYHSDAHIQSRMSVLVAAFLVVYHFMSESLDMTMLNSTLGFGLVLGLVLYTVFSLTLFGVKRLNPAHSALLLSLNVPVSYFLEVRLLSRPHSYIFILFSVLYVILVGLITSQKLRSESRSQSNN